MGADVWLGSITVVHAKRNVGGAISLLSLYLSRTAFLTNVFSPFFLLLLLLHLLRLVQCPEFGPCVTVSVAVRVGSILHLPALDAQWQF